MIYALKSPLALYAALREAGVSHERALAAVDAFTSDLLTLAAQQNPEGSPSGKNQDSAGFPH